LLLFLSYRRLADGNNKNAVRGQICPNILRTNAMRERVPEYNKNKSHKLNPDYF
jgi:hypothetical protein